MEGFVWMIEELNYSANLTGAWFMFYELKQVTLLNLIESDASTKEISNAKKELKTLDKKIEELKEYDELLQHMADMQMKIDLDDGVAVNYEKFKGLVAPIK